MADNINSTVGSETAPLKEQVKQKAQQAVEQGQQAVGNLADQAKTQVKTQVSTQKDNAVTGLKDVSQALVLTGSHLRDAGQNTIGQYLDQAAEQVTRVSTYFGEHDVDQLVGEVESLARRNPALFLGGAVTLGLVLARFLKSSGHNGGSSGVSASAHAMIPSPSVGEYSKTGGFGKDKPHSTTTGYSASEPYGDSGRGGRIGDTEVRASDAT